MSRDTKFAFALSVALHSLLIAPFALLREPQEKRIELKFCSLQNIPFEKEPTVTYPKEQKRVEKEPQKKWVKSEQKIKPTGSGDRVKPSLAKADEQNNTEPRHQAVLSQSSTQSVPSALSISSLPSKEQKSSEEPVAKVDPSKEYLKANISAIKKAIEKFKRYPPIGVKMGYEGITKVSFRLTPSGVLERVEVVQSSGFSVLDKSSIKTIEEAAEHMPKPPSTITITVPIEYRLE